MCKCAGKNRIAILNTHTFFSCISVRIGSLTSPFYWENSQENSTTKNTRIYQPPATGNVIYMFPWKPHSAISFVTLVKCYFTEKLFDKSHFIETFFFIEEMAFYWEWDRKKWDGRIGFLRVIWLCLGVLWCRRFETKDKQPNLHPKNTWNQLNQKTPSNTNGMLPLPKKVEEHQICNCIIWMNFYHFHGFYIYVWNAFWR